MARAANSKDPRSDELFPGLNPAVVIALAILAGPTAVFQGYIAPTLQSWGIGRRQWPIQGFSVGRGCWEALDDLHTHNAAGI